MLRKAREAVPEAEMRLEWRLRHAILSARMAVHGSHRLAPERGMRLLQPFVEPSRSLPEFQAWVLSDIAKYAALGHSFDHALSLAEQARVAAEQSDNWMELWLRCCDYGDLLVEAGRPEEALEVIPDPCASRWNGVRVVPSDFGGYDGYELACLSRAEANYALGDLSEARRTLGRVQETLETTGTTEDRQRAAALAVRLSSP
jgi:hypothetical protein